MPGHGGRIDQRPATVDRDNLSRHKTSRIRGEILNRVCDFVRAGNPVQFQKHCEYLAARDMVAMTVDYRVSSRHGVTANQCVADAKSAVRWMRSNADRLGIDRNKIVAAGGSAGGHLAASTAILPDHDDPNDDLSLSAVPNAMALFNPAVVLATIPGERELGSAIIKMLSEN